MPDYATQRVNMVASQVFANGVTEERILDAFRAVPREPFVPAAKRGIAYAEAPLEIAPARFLLSPRCFAKLVQLAEIAPDDTVLDVGCATGYSTAVIARLARRVTGLEEDAALLRVASDTLHSQHVANATIVQGALAQGHRGGGPYDAIVIEGGVEEVPESLLAQLAEGGRLVAILQREAQGRAIVFLEEGGRTGLRFDFDDSATVLPGFRKPAAFVF
ncbi:MAG TPA: protein-L-isoaspartate O-methyltransferase [Rhizomicrobium sp.]|jgi:protein-L-isoaspartate(D-aspartate) O-methyltransferase|nr:protein-L-isoaspartate O-methyltransferase [Rhizomicrobium sp.]